MFRDTSLVVTKIPLVPADSQQVAGTNRAFMTYEKFVVRVIVVLERLHTLAAVILLFRWEVVHLYVFFAQNH
jgi:hypothetical protein